jgi:hypothetical protein
MMRRNPLQWVLGAAVMLATLFLLHQGFQRHRFSYKIPAVIVKENPWRKPLLDDVFNATLGVSGDLASRTSLDGH